MIDEWKKNCPKTKPISPKNRCTTFIFIITMLSVCVCVRYCSHVRLPVSLVLQAWEKCHFSSICSLCFSVVIWFSSGSTAIITILSCGIVSVGERKYVWPCYFRNIFQDVSTFDKGTYMSCTFRCFFISCFCRVSSYHKIFMPIFAVRVGNRTMPHMHTLLRYFFFFPE